MAKKGKAGGNPRKSMVAKVPKEHTFHIDFYSEVEDRQLEGWFTVRKPSMTTSMAIEGKKSELLGGKYYDPNLPGRGVPQYAGLIAEAMAFLSETLVSAPDWWDMDELSDPELLFAVYEEAAVVDPFREPEDDSGVDGESAGLLGETGSDESDSHDADAQLAALVDEEIPTADH